MRRVEKDFNTSPPKLKNCATKNETDLLLKIINNDCYKKTKTELERLYFKKCAYCETNYDTNSYTEIEHYRPKSKNDYYWLAYEWSNLFPACRKCNNSKSNKFPIMTGGVKINNPALLSNGKFDISKNEANNLPLINEKPYILHPEIDNPVNFFNFEIDKNKNGINIIGSDNEGRGKKTIEICSLNRNNGEDSGLTFHRQKNIIDNLIEQFDNISELLYGNEKDQKYFIKITLKIFKKLKEKSENKKLEHTLLRKYIISSENNFEKIVCPYIEKRMQKYILIAFKIYLKK